MIDKNELQRRNILLYIPNGNYISVESIGEYWINAAGGNEGDAYENLSGVPLIHDIMLKCGFLLKSLPEKYISLGPIHYYEHQESGLKISTQDDKFYIVRIYDSMSLYSISKAFESLHELQNIYYWLSGKKELEVKL